MSNDIKVSVSFNDHDISILVFKRDGETPIILYYQSYKLNNEIEKGFIVDFEKVSSIVEEMINKASKFIGFVIKAVYVSIDIKKIRIRDFGMQNISVPGGILDSNVWTNEIFPKMNISQEAEEYIFDVSIDEWVINGRTHYSLDSQYQTKSIDIKGHIYLMSHIQFNQYVSLFKNHKIKVFKCQPMVMNYVTLTKSSRMDNYEMFVNLNYNGLILTITRGNHIFKNICVDKHSMHEFINLLIKKTNLSYEQIKEMLLIFPQFQQSTSDVKIANEYNNKYLELKTTTTNDLKSILYSFAHEISKTIEEHVTYLKDNNRISICKINLFSSSEINDVILKYMMANLDTHNSIVEFNNLSLPQKFRQAILLTYSILTDNKRDVCVEMYKKNSRTKQTQLERNR